MFFRNLNKKPILFLGILMMLIFLLNLFQSDLFKSYKDKLNTSSCRALVVNLDKRIPSSWTLYCKDNSVTLIIPNKEHTLPDNLRPLLYKLLANTLVWMAEHAPEENLERTFSVSIKIVHPKLTISSLVTGKNLVKFKNLKTPELIAEHLKASVTVQELTPTK